ncbi:EscU/YscU/HrcU family type III secretion system export apparatus switch protein [Mameliella sediminis]|uniref:EscU/YscU/HrcU family type III secretion system export apparatus switch protein n=1 Tax=Mameliella sediminis TaxID=2836866 RepID=UPI001C46B79C|nr:flagellar type III secretion system protein FlhB [Mameliella sediminis]MBY6114042.1 flagellar type III secretion system protein FlhB [Antarctobacter heliothermus]MBY6142610.1 flagellar type III secretion system protein FlhB [Mameliella alba]MBV7395339.1 flagellar type III secretion system protein FlhB [Mameliella sediminis]MBY6159465.1 flagellar type III secretion system protein FlhB [Mameliella alba]MBY6167936.1 flagellar type III secretion system protein FlhB [Mameliella alba]
MSEQDESSEKSHEPSQRKLEEARKKGEIARAPDLLTAMAYLGMLLCMAAIGGYSLPRFAESLLPMIEQPDRLQGLFFGDGATAVTGSLIVAGLMPALPFLITPGILILLTLFATRGLVFTGSKLSPKISRINPLENAKNKFGRRGLFEFFKSFVKLSVYSVLLAFFLRGQLDVIVGAAMGTPGEVVLRMTELMQEFLLIVVLIAAVIGGIDWFWQRAEHIRKNRMTQKELRDEMKEAEGDPHLKQHRRMRAQELALNQMMGEVPNADVVIVNPTHYAVALSWSRMAGSAPVCVAKGHDEVALRIREAAKEAGVPIHSDPPTARALYATTEIGDEIAPDHYRPVAAAIRFADRMRKKAKERGW